MPLIWLTGVPGAGKSAVAAELARQGVDAHDADQDGFRVWQDRATGALVEEPGRDLRPQDWSERHQLVLLRERVERLRKEAVDRPSVLAGHVPDEDELLDLFDCVVALVVDDETLADRLATRPGRSFGKTPEVRDVILSWNAASGEKYRAMRAHVVDATQPLAAVVAAVRRFIEQC